MDSESDSDTSSVTWALDNEGIFSVCSARKAYDDFYLTSHHVVPFFRTNWIPPKLPTKVNLIRRGINAISSQCALCNDEPEDEDHLFNGSIGNRRLVGVETTQIHSIEELFGWGLNESFNKDQQKALMGVVYTYFWLIWQFINGKIFTNPLQNYGSTISSQLQAITFFWFKNRAKCREFRHNWIGWCTSPASCF
ncbi:hypothetical protein OSB04_024755 [Centaurea solstitialis]|uniref:Reverse transcriptase zinc-binding domain-containing protein n=1 Tax=Centaurea solstitialis TaxID=347529 RepID=A0AA38T672_9ASTR|nr:hypothetical protein OSB04_024755 [Centaurea solstitialis]